MHRPFILHLPMSHLARIFRFVYASEYPQRRLLFVYATCALLGTLLLKTLYGIIVLPLTVRIVRLLKRIEGEDVIDDNVRYGFWRITDL